ncbi:lytic murein transglycosylase [Denitrobaculum tricleocarpae]|uniref:Lytic murein transglycosylase n=1 Tax=Denitrobaculum tricleocarpae TaxID=2591009 RepID=A0A545TPT2_9PROT|nr:lytic murein transglycosylase [Denitrobaculum tricleocarpae]
MTLLIRGSPMAFRFVSSRFLKANTAFPAFCRGKIPSELRWAVLSLSLLAGLSFAIPHAIAQTDSQTPDQGNAGAQAEAVDQDFLNWVEAFKREARAKGISQEILDSSFKDIAPVKRVIELDRRQPEFSLTFWTYLNRSVNDARVKKAQELMVQHARLLSEVERKYGVQARFLVSFWGLESNFGSNTGGFKVIPALATLAHDARRADFFRTQLINALQIIDNGDIASSRMTGSWAGAMGQVQFIPSTFLGHAVDADGDGRRDLWNSMPDIFSSAANFLSNLGWNDSETWGREVKLPPGFDLELIGFQTKKTVGDWQALGVRRADGRNLPVANVEGSLVLPAGHKGPAFLVYGNFRATLKWNNSIFYAIAVGHLADRIEGKGRLLAKAPANDKPLLRAEIQEIQTLLNRLGYDVGRPDGVAGRQTRSGIKAFQRRSTIPADGYADISLLERLRAAVAN